MSKKLRRILSLALVLCCLLACAPSAFAERTSSARSAKSAKFDIITCGDKIVGRITTVTIQNTSKTDLFNGGHIRVNISNKNCTILSPFATRLTYLCVAPGQTKTFKIITWLGNAGDTSLTIKPEDAGVMSCIVKVNDNSSILRR